MTEDTRIEEILQRLGRHTADHIEEHMIFVDIDIFVYLHIKLNMT